MRDARPTTSSLAVLAVAVGFALLGWSTCGRLAAAYVIDNVNITVLDNPYRGDASRYAWWLTGGSSADAGCISGLARLWVSLTPGRTSGPWSVRFSTAADGGHLPLTTVVV